MAADTDPPVVADTGLKADPIGESAHAEISGKERLQLAREILVGLALFCAFILVGYGFNPASEAFKAMFELVKIGALPVLPLVLSFYFPHAHRHEK